MLNVAKTDAVKQLFQLPYQWKTVWGVALIGGLLILSGCAGLPFVNRPQPDWLVAKASALYRPVDVPGRQRREAQQDAEMLARRQLMNEIGKMRINSRETLSDIITRDTRLRAHVTELVRTAEVDSWRVDEQRGEVEVSVRLDRNRVWQLLSPDGQN